MQEREGACETCRNVWVLYGGLDQLALDEVRHALLLRCPTCDTLYEIFPEERTAPERLTVAMARKRFPGAL